MKVKELSAALSKLDPDLSVLCYTEDDRLLGSPDRGFLLLEVESVDTSDAERTRLDDNTPYLKIGKSPASVQLAILHVTSDF